MIIIPIAKKYDIYSNDVESGGSALAQAEIIYDIVNKINTSEVKKEEILEMLQITKNLLFDLISTIIDSSRNDTFE